MDGCPLACFPYWTTHVLCDMLTSTGASALAGCEFNSLGFKGGGTEARRALSSP
jgi:hypothetical protein